MATIRFSSGSLDTTIDVAPRGGQTVLSVAREHGLGLLFNCGFGDCGACLVEIEATSKAPLPPLTDKESFFLQALDELRAGEGGGADGRAEPQLRLACQCAAGDTDMRVSFESGLSSY